MIRKSRERREKERKREKGEPFEEEGVVDGPDVAVGVDGRVDAPSGDAIEGDAIMRFAATDNVEGGVDRLVGGGEEARFGRGAVLRGQRVVDRGDLEGM